MRAVLLAVAVLCGVWVGPREIPPKVESLPQQPSLLPNRSQAVQVRQRFDLREIHGVTPITGGWLVPTDTPGKFDYIRDPNHESEPKR